MCSLLELPTEILINIADSFDHDSPERPADLANLSYTCRKMRDIAQQALFGSVILKLSEWSLTEKILLFSRIVARYPVLAQKVKRLYLDSSSDLSYQFYYEATPQKGPEFSAFTKELLALLPNVEYLTLYLANTHPVDLLKYLASELVIRSDGILGNLRTIQIFRYDIAFNLKDYVDLMKLPNLQKIRLEIMPFNTTDDCLPHNLLSRKQVELYSGLMNVDSLQTYLKLCPSLKSFSFRNPSKAIHPVREMQDNKLFRPGHLVKALLDTHSSTLEQFTAIFTGGDETYTWDTNVGEDYENDGAIYTFPSFAGFTRLKKMSIEYSEIQYHFNYLPPTLEHLRLLVHENKVPAEDPLLHTLQHLDTTLSNIKDVVVNGVVHSSESPSLGAQLYNSGHPVQHSHCRITMDGEFTVEPGAEEYMFRVFDHLGLGYGLQIREFMWERYKDIMRELTAAEERVLLGTFVPFTCIRGIVI